MPPLSTTTSRPEPSEPPEAKITGIVATRGNTRALELQVNIGGQDRKFLLTLDALEGRGLSGPAAVEELRAIRLALEELVQVLKRGPETE